MPARGSPARSCMPRGDSVIVVLPSLSRPKLCQGLGWGQGVEGTGTGAMAGMEAGLCCAPHTDHQPAGREEALAAFWCQQAHVYDAKRAQLRGGGAEGELQLPQHTLAGATAPQACPLPCCSMPWPQPAATGAPEAAAPAPSVAAPA
jgi:hypothetical protein